MLNALVALGITQKAAAADSRERDGQQRRITSFIRARDGVRGYKGVITSGAQAQREIPGVGKGL